ncbi:MAG: alpha/beta hydrolase [Pseudolabrys sp.]
MNERLKWNWNGKSIDLGFEMRGEGSRLVLLLPALSSISTRAEMRPLAERLSADFKTLAVDWPGFGDSQKSAVAWQPDAYRAFIEFLLREFPNPFATVAAGHGAGYLIGHAAQRPGSAGRLCLIAPTWRGPLPTMMGRRHHAFRMIARLVDAPLLGAALYRLNVNRPVIRMMGRGHVYSDCNWLEGGRLAAKLKVTNARGARHASFRFVAGELDPMQTRDEFLQVARRISDPTLVVYGADSPCRSKAEMQEFAALPGIASQELAQGKLAVHEEFPNKVANVIRNFLQEQA